jgi:hypothetical protein
MNDQPIDLSASTIAAEIAMTIMRTPGLDPDLRFAAAHVGLWLQDGPHDLVAFISESTVRRIQLKACHEAR